MNIVVISRQVGSFGDEIASLVAAEMGLELIGRDGLHKLALSCEPDYSAACAAYEKEHGAGFFERIFFDRPSYLSLFEAMAFEQASRGNVVMVGRGAQIVLRGFPGVFTTRIVAPFAVRVRRVQERSGSSAAVAEDFVKKYDRDRRSLIQSIFMANLDDWGLYDVILNTERYTAHAAAKTLIEAVRQTMPVPDKAQSAETFKALAVAKRAETLVRNKLTSAVARDIKITAERGGVVRMTGLVAQKADKEFAEEIVSQCPGVIKVENDLVITEGFRFLL
ncbi:MAG: BON domain-containing protein [Deltaproteobacteria bacterium]|nr:BON domain-containing protein [Deltaproteobacteria bacterium]